MPIILSCSKREKCAICQRDAECVVTLTFAVGAMSQILMFYSCEAHADKVQLRVDKAVVSTTLAPMIVII